MIDTLRGEISNQTSTDQGQRYCITNSTFTFTDRGARRVQKCGRTTGGERSEFEGDDT